MNNQRSKEITVGIISIVALALLVLGITLGKGISVRTSSVELKLRFPNSGGIQEGAPVVVNGVKRGYVNSVKNDNGSVIINATLDKIGDLKSDVRARISILEITGGKKIEIFPGTSNEQYSVNNEIPGETPPDIAELVALVGEVSGDAITLIRRVDTAMGEITGLLADGKVMADVRTTADNAAEITQNLNSFVKNNYSKLEKTVNNLETLTAQLKSAVDRYDPQIGMILTKIDGTLGDLKKLSNSADTALTNINGVVRDVSSITGEIKNGNGLVSRLIYDKEMASRLDSTLTELGAVMTMIRQYGVNVNVRLGSNP